MQEVLLMPVNTLLPHVYNIEYILYLQELTAWVGVQ
jgi:hypothetical protein